MTIRAENETTLVRVDDGEEGADGTTFYPSVSSEGFISWTNDGEKPNPEPVVIKGPQGISLNSVTRYYKLSDTTPTDYPPSTGWQTSEPAYTPGDASNLYVCDLFAWSNSTVTASEISLSSSYEAAKQAFDAAQGAMTAANGKNKVYHSALEPTGGTYNNGDIWFDTDNDYKMYIHNGTSWEASAFGNNAIASSGIDAGKITVGTLDANRIAAKSLVIGQMADESQSQILNSNVQVGGRNWLQRTGDLSQWNYNTTYVTEDDFNGSEINFKHGSELSWSYYINTSKADMVFPYADVKDKQFTISFEAKVDVVGSGTSEYLHYTVNGQATAGGSRTKYREWSIYNNSTSTDHLNTTYTKYSRTLTINDALFTAGSGDVNFVYFSFYNYSLANISVRNIKLELGNKATDWSPAPEDVDGDINDLMSFRDSVANEGYTSIDGSKIGSGTITLGGTVNGDGSLEVYDSSNNLVAKLSKDENIFAGFKIKVRHGRLLLEDSGGMYTWLRSTDYEYEYDYFFEPIHTAQIAQYTFGNEFLYDSFDGWYQSNNKGLSSTAALDVIELDLAEGTHLYMDVVDYNNETSNDYGTVGTIDGTALDETSTYSTTNSQVKWTGYNNHKQGGETIDFGIVSAGRHRIWIRYKKNTSVDNENDRLYFTLYTDKEDALVYEDDNKYTLMYISKTRIYQRKIIRDSENNMISYDVYKTLSRNGNIKSEHAQSDYVSSGTKEIPLNSYESETNINGSALEFSNEGRNSTISFYGPAEPNGMYHFESGMNVFGEIDNNGFPIWNLQNSLVVTGHVFVTTVNSGSQDSWEKVITKSGYYPLGVVGFGIGSSYARIFYCNLLNRSLGSTTLHYSVRADGGKVNNANFRAEILWAKAYGDPG